MTDVDSMELLSVWRDWLEASYAPSTVEAYWGAVIRFMAHHPIPLVMVTEAMIAGWIETFPFRSSRRVTYFHGLRSLFAFAHRHGHITIDPTAGIRLPMVEEKEPRALTVQEYEAVRDAAYRHNPVRGFTVELFYYSGGRLGEVLNLRWDQVTEGGVVFRQTKGGRERTIPWSPGLHRAIDGLRSHFGEQDRVLPRAEQTVWLWMREAGRDAGVPNVHPHLFRATAATMMSRRGASMPVVGKVLGHRKLTTTQRYRAVEQDETADAVQLL